MKLVSLDPKDRTVNRPAVLVDPRQIGYYVSKRLEGLSGESIYDLTPMQIMNIFISDMTSEKYGWSTALKCGQQCLLQATVHIVSPKQSEV